MVDHISAISSAEAETTSSGSTILQTQTDWQFCLIRSPGRPYQPWSPFYNSTKGIKQLCNLKVVLNVAPSLGLSYSLVKELRQPQRKAYNTTEPQNSVYFPAQHQNSVYSLAQPDPCKEPTHEPTKSQRIACSDTWTMTLTNCVAVSNPTQIQDTA